MRFHPRCAHTIRTIPALGYDRTKVEDVDRSQENHAYDCTCAWLGSRPQRPAAPAKPVDPDVHPGFQAIGVRRQRWEQAVRQQLTDGLGRQLVEAKDL